MRRQFPATFWIASMHAGSRARRFVLPILLAGMGCLAQQHAAHADDLTNSIIAINNEFLNDTRLTSGLLVAGPPEVAREIAIIDSAMYDAANAASGTTASGFAYTGPAAGASVDIAALSAGMTALQGIFGNQIWGGVPYTTSAGTTNVGGSVAIQARVLASIQSTYTTSLSNLITLQAPGAGTIATSLSLGQAAGTANLVANGYFLGTNGLVTTAPGTGPGGSYTQIAAGITNPYTPASSSPGVYVPPSVNPVATGGASTRVAMFPAWGSVAPTGMSTTQLNAIESTVPAPPAISSPAYAAALLQVECQGSGTALPGSIVSACTAAGLGPQTTAEAKAALFWNDPGTTLQPPGHWLQISNTLAQSSNLSTLQAANMMALVGQAMDDAGIIAWNTKYQYNLWRPVNAIQYCATNTAAGTVSWNASFTTCDTSWTALIATPPHPDYMAGHPAFSGAAATVLAAFLGTDNVTFNSTSDAYCNGGTTFRATGTATIAACGVTSGIYVYNDGTQDLPTIYTAGGSGCTSVGGTNGTAVFDGITQNTCTVGGTTYVFNPNESASGCNSIVNPGGTNDSALICPITETFNTISAASSGVNGSEFSRIDGGIHTPFSVENALTVGNQAGTAVAQNNGLPEPGGLSVMVVAIVLGMAARRIRRWA